MKAGRELDAKVAEFMGIVIRHVPKNIPYLCIDNDYVLSGGSYFLDSDGNGSFDIPYFSDDISAALPVLEKAKKNFFSTTITMWDHTDKVVIVGDKRQGHNENISVLTVQAATLPLAICKFALRTKENENE